MLAATADLSRLVSFDYGQRHTKELDFAAACVKRLDVPYHVIDLRSVGATLTGLALTDDLEELDEHYEVESMKFTVIPNRNAIMLSIAYGIAAAQGDDAVATADNMARHFFDWCAAR